MNQKLLSDLAKLMRFDRPAGTILLLWPTLWALVLASRGIPSFALLMIFVSGVIVMRAAGCIVNDIADRDFDKHVVRTKNRPLATGAVTVKQALVLLAGLLGVALGLIWNLNMLTQATAVVALALAILYPFTKRFFPFPQLVLGIVWSFGILMAFTAVTNSLSIVAFLIYAAHLLLTVAYDTMYAMADKPDDLKLGLHSSAVLFGTFESAYIALFQFLALGCLILVGITAQLHWPFALCLVFASVLMLYQQYLIRDREPALCLQAFLNNQWVGFLILIGIFFGC